MDTCICMAEFLHCSPKTIRTLLIVYTPINMFLVLKRFKKKKNVKGLPGGPVVKNLPSIAGDEGSIPGQVPGAGILHTECILHIECSTFYSIIFQDLE